MVTYLFTKESDQEPSSLLKTSQLALLSVRRWLWFQNATSLSVPFARTLLRLIKYIIATRFKGIQLSEWVSPNRCLTSI